MYVITVHCWIEFLNTGAQWKCKRMNYEIDFLKIRSGDLVRIIFIFNLEK
ncbi:hypothetical protein P872_14030 [Rhodonellum psychrophilum GCM71 = DSM 17998]|uniref:Uncharacterized protein n=1 Tax=Rhodonellum psychrophilum GCM71 = DSM 17998 TaxID=1123057 RepID=U5BQJ3_9BACT|nr:hypothetical protein P872_14030 [Rhodonellum psychrophilum GCM71 = DSM 17998]